MMNEILKAMETRQSVRAYRPDPIDEETLNAILRAGTFAPSGMGRQSGKIVVVQDPATREILRAKNAEVIGNPDADPFYGAPTVLVVLADSTVPTWVEDGSLVMGNLLLAASALGVGACWIHRARETFDSPEGKALLRKWGIPETYRGVGNCILGYPAAEPQPKKPRKADFIVRVG
ncbi:MAG TPA: nitroreductase [Candidatus Avoscillospira avicola]|uniref:Nitroreductase n=1 Tax=Candidatus Avoscillospira avicola TaxID=2840706 RepID=A0A9D1IWW1_9FIRM|nr:nitroreductase [Candidatus Avoscillospira avicola]